MKIRWWLIVSFALVIGSGVQCEDEYENEYENESSIENELKCTDYQELMDGACVNKTISDDFERSTRASTEEYHNESHSYQMEIAPSSTIQAGYANDQAYVVYGGRTSCPATHQMIGGQCIKNIISCPNGYYLENNQCLMDNSILTCPQGFELRGNKCYQIGCIAAPLTTPRPPIYHPIECPFMEPIRGSPPKVVINCPPGTNLRNGVCYMDVPAVSFTQVVVRCPPGSRKEGDMCVMDIAPPQIFPQVHVRCPPGSFSENNGCYIIPRIVHPPPTVQFRCPPNSRLENGICYVTVEMTQTPRIVVRCPAGTIVEGNNCVYIPPSPPTISVIPRCPPGTVQEGNVCYHTPQGIPSFTVVNRCPPGTVMDGNTCYQDVVAVPPPRVNFRCPHNAFLEGNTCVVNVPMIAPPNVQIRCPPNSIQEGNTCVVHVTSIATGSVVIRCPPNSIQEGNTCYVNVPMIAPPNVQIRCPPNSIQEGNTCVVQVTGVVTPSVVIRCPPNSIQEGNICYVNVPMTTPPMITVRCPPNTQLMDNQCVYFISPPPQVDVIVRCPPQFSREGNMCVRQLTTPEIPIINIPEKIIQGQCCDSKGSETVFHNNNTIHAPVNVTSTNINTITIHPGGCKDEKTTVIRNGVSETVPCQEPEVEKEDTCCNIHTPRLCHNNRGQWECGHKQYRRCGDFCTKDNIYLRPVQSVYRNNCLVMPPASPGVRVMPRRGSRVNCYGCLSGSYSCSSECYEYDCEQQGCNLVDQDSFCSNYGGQGCTQDDGYIL